MTTHPQTGSVLGANMLCTLSMIIWAAGLPAADFLIPHVPALQLSTARVALAAAVLLPVWWWLDRARARLTGAEWLRGLGIGAMLGLGALTLLLGQGMTDAVTVAVISATMPVIGIALEVVLDRRRLTAGILIGVLLSLAGGAITLLNKLGGLQVGLGAALCLLSIVAFTLGSRLTVTAFPSLTPIGRTTVTLAGAALVSFVAAMVAMATGDARPDWAALGWPEFGALLIFSIGGLAISQILWIMAVGRLGIGLSSLHINLTPFYVMAILYAMGGSWNWMQALGAAIVGLGVLVAQGVIPLPRVPRRA